MNKKVGRPKGLTKERLALREAVNTSIESLSSRALSGDARAQELLIQVAASDPALHGYLERYYLGAG